MTDEVKHAAPRPEVEPILQKALGYAEEWAWEEAAEFLREALADHPEDPYILCWLGLAERELGLEGVAYERFRLALEQEPRDPVLLATAGNALAHFDDPAAEAALRTAALLAPDLPQARWMYGAWLAREGMLSDALAELDAALELDPEDGVIRTERGVALALSGRLEEAAAAFGSAVEVDPEDSWSLALLGLALLESGDPEGAARELDGAARLRPDDVEIQLLAALALGAIEEEGRGFEMLERARMLVDEGADRQLVLEVEERLEAGSGAATRFLRNTLGPTAFRERLMLRP
jgi:protein O-GlcNAc transferase